MTFDKDKLSAIVNEALDVAEKHWGKANGRLILESAEMEINKRAYDELPSRIPGHALVSNQDTVIDEFIAVVVDMRDSTSHLRNATGKRRGNISQLQRVFYETSALLPAIDYTISSYGGSVTEYLGDGVLSFFKVNEKEKTETITQAFIAAECCISQTRDVLNYIMYERYSLEPMDIGVGMSMSQAIVSLVGYENNLHPKAFGECVFMATKLSGGRNKIAVDPNLNRNWPSSKGGRLTFTKKKVHDNDAYIINLN